MSATYGETVKAMLADAAGALKRLPVLSRAGE